MASSTSSFSHEHEDDAPAPCMVWFGPKLDVARQLRLCVWKNMTLRLNRPVASLMEILVPLVAFVALSVLTPRNDYFNAGGHIPGSNLIPPACVLHPDVPRPNFPTINREEAASPILDAMTPGVCLGAGEFVGPFKQVPFSPDTEATRALMRAACELRWYSPSVEVVDDGFSPYSTPAGTRGGGGGNSSGGGGNNVNSSSGSGRRRAAARRLLFDQEEKDFTPALAPPMASPAPPSWPACTPVGYPSEASMLAAVVGGDAAGGGYRATLAVSFDAGGNLAGGYTIRTSDDSDMVALEFQERISNAFVAIASVNGTGEVRFAVPTMWRSFPLPPIYPSSTYAFVAKFLPLAVVVSWVYTLILCAGGVAGEREKGLEAAMRALGLRLWVHWAGHWGACMMLLGIASLFCGATLTSFGSSIFIAGTPGLVFLLLLLAAAAAVSGCFLVAAISPDAATAASATAVVWLVAYLPYAVVASSAASASAASTAPFSVAAGVPAVAIALACALPSSALGLGVAALAQWEAAGEGATWSTVWTTPPANQAGDAGVPLGAALLLLFLNAVVGRPDNCKC